MEEQIREKKRVCSNNILLSWNKRLVGEGGGGRGGVGVV
jgi:hypothetical protein